MAQVETAPFLLVRRSEAPPELRRYRVRRRCCQAVFGLAMVGLCSLLAYEVKEAREAGTTIATLLPLR